MMPISMSVGEAIWRLATTEKPDDRLIEALNQRLPTEPQLLNHRLSAGQLKLVVVWLSRPIAAAALACLIGRQLLTPAEALFVGRHVIICSPSDSAVT